MTGSLSSVALPPMPMALPALGAHAQGNASIDKAAQSFEEMFATQLIQPMFQSVGVNPVFGGGHGEEAMRSFLVQEYGKKIAATGLLKIAPQVKAAMLHAQEFPPTSTLQEGQKNV